MTSIFDRRIDKAMRVIQATPQTIYEAFIDPNSFVKWLPPHDMKGHIFDFDAREGGSFKMSLTYIGNHTTIGKTTDDSDVFQGTFQTLVPGERIVLFIGFESEDPLYSGEMTMTWNLSPVSEGTEVTIICENVPQGIDQDDHITGLKSTLDNLAVFTE